MLRLLQCARHARSHARTQATTIATAARSSPIALLHRLGAVRRAMHATTTPPTLSARSQQQLAVRDLHHTAAVDSPQPSSATPPPAALSASPLPAAFVAAMQRGDFVEAERLALQLSHAPSDGSASSTADDAAPLALADFHALFQSLLDACVAPSRRRDAQFPPGMRGAQLDGSMLSFCAGTQCDAANAGESPRFVRELFQPDYHFSARVWRRVQSSLQSSSSSAVTTPSSDHTHARWLLTLALEDVRKSEEAVAAASASTDAEASTTEMATESLNDAEHASTQPLPPLSLVRHLFSALHAADLRPDVQCFNLILAIHDERARSTAARRGSQAIAEQLTRDELQLDAQAEKAQPSTDVTSESLSPAAAAAPASTDDDLEWLWHLWLDAEKQHGVHADLLSHVLMLRLSYRHRQYSYMSRILAEFDRRASLVAMALLVLNNHVFSHPQLLLAALTHSSKARSRIDSNQRLEFLGDAVLDVLVREQLVTQSMLQHGLPLRRGDQLSREHWPPDVSEPELLRHAGLSSSVLAQLKGKHVSFHVLAKLSRQHGLTRILLEANHEVRHGIKRWIESIEETRIKALKLQQRFAPSPSPSAAPSTPASELEIIGDHLAEDVFEACLGALLLDRPLAPHEQLDKIPASDEILHTPDSGPALGPRGQSFGLTAVREFLQTTLSSQLDSDLAAIVSRTRSRKSVRFHEFDEHINYKLLLESHARRRFTDDQGVCRAHVLYQTVRHRGAHQYGVQVILRQMPRNSQDNSFAQYLPRMHGGSDPSLPSSPASSARASVAPISFSVVNIPDLTQDDQMFDVMMGGPTQHNAEQLAAFRACQQLRILPTAIGNAKAPSVVPSSSVPFPFRNSAEYAGLLDRLQRLTGHRFRNPLLVRALFFHAGPLTRNLEFLGSGVWRFQISQLIYTLYPECDEGSMTRVKDLMAQRVHTQEAMFCEPFLSELEEIRSMLEEAKSRWPSLNVRPLNSSALDPHQLVLSGDLLEPLLAALYLDGGIAVVDPFAHRVLRPRLEQVHEMLRAELPDRDLHSLAYRERVQQFVQRVYGVTPQLEIVEGISDQVCNVRLVIPAARSRGAPLVECPEVAFKDAPLPGAVAGEKRDYVIVFPSCRATKTVAEMRASRLAFMMLTAHKRLDSATSEDSSEEELPPNRLDVREWRPRDLRGVLHSIAKQPPAAWANHDRAQQLRDQLQRLVSALLQTDARFVAFPIPSSESASEVAGQSSSSRWRFSDYTLLLELLQRCEDSGSAFSALWQLLSDIDYPLSAATAHSLIDAFAGEGNMGLIIQLLRRIKIQSRWIADSSLLHRAMIRCTQANPVWGWQQMPKMMETALEGASSPGSIDVLVANSALYMCVRSLWCLAALERRQEFGLIQPPSLASGLTQVNISPHMVMRTADELRAKLAKANLVPNEITVALIVILDAYGGRLVPARRALNELLMLVRQRFPSIDQRREVRAGLACMAELEQFKQALATASNPYAALPGSAAAVPFTLRAAPTKASRNDIERFSERAEPLVIAVETMCAAMHGL